MPDDQYHYAVHQNPFDMQAESQRAWDHLERCTPCMRHKDKDEGCDLFLCLKEAHHQKIAYYHRPTETESEQARLCSLLYQTEPNSRYQCIALQKQQAEQQAHISLPPCGLSCLGDCWRPLRQLQFLFKDNSWNTTRQVGGCCASSSVHSRKPSARTTRSQRLQRSSECCACCHGVPFSVAGCSRHRICPACRILASRLCARG